MKKAGERERERERERKREREERERERGREGERNLHLFSLFMKTDRFGQMYRRREKWTDGQGDGRTEGLTARLMYNQFDRRTG